MSLLLPEEAAERLRVQPSTVLNYLRRGQLKGCKIARKWRVPEDEVERFIRTAMHEDMTAEESA